MFILFAVFAASTALSLETLPIDLMMSLFEKSVFAGLFFFILWWYLRDNKIEKENTRATFGTLSSKMDTLISAVGVVENKINRSEQCSASTNDDIKEINKNIQDMKLTLITVDTIVKERLKQK